MSSAAPPIAYPPETPSRWRRVVGPWQVALVIVLAWEGLCRLFQVPVYFVPAPTAIIAQMFALGTTVVDDIVATTLTILAGFALSVVVGLPLAVLLASLAPVAEVVWPLLVVTQSVPKVALAPILVLLLGTTELSRVVITFLVAFFPLVLSTMTGLRAVPPSLLELGYAYRVGWWMELTSIRLPYALPFIFSGLKTAMTFAVVGAVVAEFVNADRGLGYLIATTTAFFNTPAAWGALVLLSLLGVALFQAIVFVESRWFSRLPSKDP